MMKLSKLMVTILLFVFSAAVCAQATVDVLEGEASFYSDTLDGQKTASGSSYDKTAMTAAHHTLAFGTRVKVTYPETGKSVVVVIDDRIPSETKRTIDLSRAAAEEIGLIKAGHGKVNLEIIAP